MKAIIITPGLESEVPLDYHSGALRTELSGLPQSVYFKGELLMFV